MKVAVYPLFRPYNRVMEPHLSVEPHLSTDGCELSKGMLRSKTQMQVEHPYVRLKIQDALRV